MKNDDDHHVDDVEEIETDDDDSETMTDVKGNSTKQTTTTSDESGHEHGCESESESESDERVNESGNETNDDAWHGHETRTGNMNDHDKTERLQGGDQQIWAGRSPQSMEVAAVDPPQWLVQESRFHAICTDHAEHDERRRLVHQF